jgi:hypothetical protein
MLQFACPYQMGYGFVACQSHRPSFRLQLCRDLQNNLAARVPIFGKFECLFHLRERQDGCHVRF